MLLPDNLLEPGKADVRSLVFGGNLLQGRKGAFVDAAFFHPNVDHRPDPGFQQTAPINPARKVSGKPRRRRLLPEVTRHAPATRRNLTA